MTPKLLIVTTVSGFIRGFLLPFIQHFKSLEWQVDSMAQEISTDPECVSACDRVWDIEWSRNPLDPRNLIFAVPRIQEIIAQGNYDLVHVHSPIAAFVTRYAISQSKIKQKPKVVYTVHGFHFHKQGNPLTNFLFLTLEKLAGNWTDYLITINREDETAAHKYRLLPAEKIFYTPGIGLDLNKYNPNQVSESEIHSIRRELGLGSLDNLLLCVAEFTPNKRHQDQIIALKKLNRSNLHLAFAGDGATRPELEQLTAKLGLQKQVHFLGFRQDIPALICSSAAILLTSQREGLPRSVMEAMCLATPVIGTKIRGIQDLLADGCGLLVNLGDTDELAQAMSQIVDEPEYAQIMAQKGQAKMADYDIKQIIEQYTDIYQLAMK